MTVAPDGVDLAVGDSLRMRATSSAGCAAPADTVMTWVFDGSDPAVATVSPDGLVTGLRAGGVAIRARGTNAAGSSRAGFAVLRVVSPGLAIEPAVGTLLLGTPVQFRAIRPVSAEPVSVEWSVTPPGAAAVTPDGLVTACHPATSFALDAFERADPSVAARVRVTVVSTLLAVAIRSLTDVATGAGAALDALRDDVDIAIGVPASGYACRSVTRLTLSLADDRGGGVLIADDPTHRPAVDFVATIRFQPRRVPPGDYRLIPTVTLDDGRMEVGSGLPVRIVP